MTTERKYLEGQVVLVGYGRVGRRIAAQLDQHAIPYVVAEQNRELVETLRRNGTAAVSGNATEPAVLIQAHIADAPVLVVALSDPINARQMPHGADAQSRYRDRIAHAQRRRIGVAAAGRRWHRVFQRGRVGEDHVEPHPGAFCGGISAI